MTDVNNFILMFYTCFNMFNYCLMVSYYIIYILYIFLNILLCMQGPVLDQPVVLNRATLDKYHNK